ncbi:MAG: phenylacetate--CoA ligase family protein [Thermoplasmata archaeon]
MSVRAAYDKLLLLTVSRMVANFNRRKQHDLARSTEKSRIYRPFYLMGYEKTQWLRREDLDRLTEKSLRFLVSYAYENVPYYHRMMKKHGISPDSMRTIKDLSRMPILTKQIIRDNFDSLISKSVPSQHRILLETGGSTGVPLRFYSTQVADTRAWASMFRARFWQGTVRNYRMAQISGTVPQPNGWKRNEIFFSAFEISEEIFPRVADELAKFRPRHITGYASYLALLANYLIENGVDNIRPYAVETQSEMVFPHMRRAIEEAFQCPVFDHYGCKETTIKACECSRHEGYHISVENGLVETIKDGDQVVGEYGSILMTDFWNLAMPFIRYDVGDSAVISDDTCSCGRSLPLIESILGRNNDIVVLPHGRFLPGEFFPHILKDVSGIRQYQVIQDSLRSFTVKMVKSRTFGDKDKQLLLSNLANWLGNEIEVNLEYVDDISLSPTGKQKIVVSKLGREKLA